MRILVVDDEPAIVQLCTKILERAGYDVAGAPNGARALELLQAEPFDLLVADFRMPGLNGLEVLTEGLRLRPGLRSLLMTGHGTQEVVQEAFRLGVKDVAFKPFTPEELLRVVDRIFHEGEGAVR